jgi:hypothetical protein
MGCLEAVGPAVGTPDRALLSPDSLPLGYECYAGVGAIDDGPTRIYGTDVSSLPLSPSMTLLKLTSQCVRTSLFLGNKMDHSLRPAKLLYLSFSVST